MHNQWKPVKINEHHWNHWKSLKTIENQYKSNGNHRSRTPRGPQKDPKRTPKGPAEDPERTPKGPRENPKRTPFGSPRTCAFGQSLHCAQSLLVCAKFARVRKVCAFAQSLRDCVKFARSRKVCANFAHARKLCAKFARSRKVCAFHGACPGCCLIFNLQILVYWSFRCHSGSISRLD